MKAAIKRSEFLSGLGASAFLAAVGVGASCLGRRTANARQRLDGFCLPPMKEIRVRIVGEDSSAKSAAARLAAHPGVTVVAADAVCDVVYNLTVGKERTRVIAEALQTGRHVISPDGIGAYPTECLKHILLAEEKRLHLAALPTTLFDESAGFFREAAAVSGEIESVDVGKTFAEGGSKYPGAELAPVFRLLDVGGRSHLAKLFAFSDKGGTCETVMTLDSGVVVTARCERGEKPGFAVTLRGRFGKRAFSWDSSGFDAVARDRAWISALQEGRPMPVSPYESARVAVVADQADWSATHDALRLDFPRF